MNIALKGCVAAAAVYAAATISASAATCQLSDVTVTMVNGSAVSSTILATSCDGEYPGNDTGAADSLVSRLNAGLFAGYSSDWSLFGKSDDAGSGVVANNGATSGTWSVNFAPDAYSVFAIALKASNGYTTYLFDLGSTAASSAGGAWANLVITNPNGKPQELSHLTVAVRETQPPAVPLPAAGWMLLAGLAGLGLAKRRKA